VTFLLNNNRVDSDRLTATPFPGENIDLDVDDPRMVERKSA